MVRNQAAPGIFSPTPLRTLPSAQKPRLVFQALQPSASILHRWLIVSADFFCHVVTTNHLTLHDFSPNPNKVWRLVTSFLFFGEHFTLDFLFHIFFLVRYCRLLEEGEFRRSTADFIYFIFFGAGFMILVAPLIPLIFLGSSLVFMMVRRGFVHQSRRV